MKGALPDYYKMLGLPATATPEEIKKRYRELARRYHPDLNPNPEAAQKIKAINEAHHVLSDPDRRALYDANRALFQSTAPAEPPQPSARPAHRPARAEPPRRPHPQGRADFNGFGRVPPEPPPSATASPQTSAPEHTSRPAAEKKPPRPSAAEIASQLEGIISQAQFAFLSRRYQQAEDLCEQALKLDRRSAVVYEILGDIYARRGQEDRAGTAYSYAIQFNPQDYRLRGKLDRLFGRRPSHVSGPTFTRPLRHSPRQRFAESPYHDLTLTLMSVLLAAAFVVILFLLSINPGAPLSSGLPWVLALSPNLLLAATLDGGIAGILLALHGGMRPLSEALVPHADSNRRAGARVPLLILLVMFALVWFYVALVVFIGVLFWQKRVSPSIARIFGTVLLLIAVFTFVPQAGAFVPNLEAAAFAGNILFPAALIGWFLGDTLRLRGR